MKLKYFNTSVSFFLLATIKIKFFINSYVFMYMTDVYAREVASVCVSKWQCQHFQIFPKELFPQLYQFIFVHPWAFNSVR